MIKYHNFYYVIDWLSLSQTYNYSLLFTVGHDTVWTIMSQTYNYSLLFTAGHDTVWTIMSYYVVLEILRERKMHSYFFL